MSSDPFSDQSIQIAASLIAMTIEERAEDVSALMRTLTGPQPARVFVAALTLAAASVTQYHDAIDLPDPALTMRGVALRAANGPTSQENS